MIKIFCRIVAALCSVSALHAQPEILERGPHHRSIKSKAFEQDGRGVVHEKTGSYVELATGMHRKDAAGEWVEAHPVIESHPSGAVAQQTAHQIIFSPEPNVVGAVDLLTPEGVRVQSHVIGLAYRSRVDGQTVLIAEITNSVGELLQSGNELLYRNCFTDGIEASLLYRNERQGFSQNVVLHSSNTLPSPTQWNLDPAQVDIEVWTEWVNSPAPKRIAQRVALESGRLADDEDLEFGDMRIVKGKSFLLNNEDEAIPVTKRLVQSEGRTFLVEATPYAALLPYLQTLPLAQGPVALRSGRTVQKSLVLPLRIARALKKPLQFAATTLPSAGVVLDYTIVSSSAGYTFASTNTYYISGAVSMTGTVTFEGGTVIKYAPAAGAKLSISAAVVCNTTEYRPVILTARDDDSVGEKIAGSGALSGLYADTAIELNYTGQEFKHFRVFYANKAFAFGNYGNSLRHCQIRACTYGVYNPQNYTAQPFGLRNILFADVTNCVAAASGAAMAVAGEHVTAARCVAFLSTYYPSVTLTNCLLVDTADGASITKHCVISTNSSATTFQGAGAGFFYLANNSPWRNGATTNITASLLTELRRKTTYPPSVITNVVDVDTTWAPFALRDMDAPDLGYHYDPIDYLASSVFVTNATLTVTNGAVVGVFGESGFRLGQGAKLVSQGSALALNQFVRFQSAQETATNLLASTNCVTFTTSAPSGTKPTATFRFTSFPMLTHSGLLYDDIGELGHFGLQDCQLWGGGINYTNTVAGTRTIGFTNNVFELVRLNMGRTNGPVDYIDLHWRNNLFRTCNTALAPGSNSVWSIRDSVFSAGAWRQGSNTVIANSHNAYSASLYLSGGFSNILGVGTPIAGPLGNYYTASPGSYQNKGSGNATAAGLFHYTISTNQVKETNSLVDIGFHYVAVSTATSQPIDTDSDGVPDYLEDVNGNGTADTGEADWKLYTSPNQLNTNTTVGLDVFSPTL